MKTIWDNIESIIIGLMAINFIIFWIIMMRYAFVSFRLSAMIDKIERDGDLENFKVPLSKYLFNFNQIEDMTLKIPINIEYHRFSQFQTLAEKVQKQRKILRWTGIPLLILTCIVMFAMATGLIE